MIDVVFFLLVFFMMASLAMTVYQGLARQPARGGERSAECRRDRVDHALRDGGNFLNREPISVAMLGTRIRPLLAKNRELAVIINADREVTHARVVDVLDELRQTGVGQDRHRGGARRPSAAMTDTLFGWAVIASIGTHVAGLAAAAALALGHGGPPPPPIQVPIEVVKVPEEKPAPPPPPKLERRPAPKPVPRVEAREPAPIQPSKLIEGHRRARHPGSDAG
jgi:biopolymer transport protein ExbD